MPTFVSEGKLKSSESRSYWSGGKWGGVRVGDRLLDYAAIYRTQPHVRTMVDLISRHMAQLGIGVYRRVGENDRQRLRKHDLAGFIHRPNGWTTRNRWISTIMSDKGVWGDSFWVKTRGARSRDPLSAIRVPPQLVEVSGGLMPQSYRINLYPEPIEGIPPEGMLHFRNFNPNSSICGLSPIESLRQLLEEDMAGVEHRRETWNNAGRQPVIITRPKEAGPWSPEAETRFSENFTAALRNPRSMSTPILEDGMGLIPGLSFNAEQSQYTESRQLTREEVASAYFVPLFMAGIAGAPTTFASVVEARKSFYVDALGPWVDEIETELDLQLFPDFSDMAGVYLEFQIMEKLQGDFETQIDILFKAIGRPFMSPDEGRSRLNLPAMGGDAEKLAVPLNIDPSGEGASEPAPALTLPELSNGRVRAPVPA